MKSSKSVFFIVSWWSKIPCHRRTRICCSFFQITGWFHSLMQVDISSRILPHCGGSYNQTLHGKAWAMESYWDFRQSIELVLVCTKELAWGFQLQTCCFFASHQIKRCFLLWRCPLCNAQRWPFSRGLQGIVPVGISLFNPCTRVSARGSTWWGNWDTRNWDLRYGTVWYLYCTVLYCTVPYDTVLCCCVVVCLFVWLVGWLVGWLVVVGWLVGCCCLVVWRLAFGVVIGVWCLVFGVWCLCLLLLLLLIIYSPLEFSLGNGGPGPHEFFRDLGFRGFQCLTTCIL